MKRWTTPQVHAADRWAARFSLTEKEVDRLIRKRLAHQRLNPRGRRKEKPA